MRSNEFPTSSGSLCSHVTHRFESWWGALFLATIFFVFHPDLFFLNKNPMGGDLWAIKDPVVSWDVFMPGFREFRYELLEHFNILWSNLRGMGQPVLGNGVQGAPLFPLSLALIWLPDQLFWSVMPTLRIILISLMLFLTARNVFKMPISAALIFAILAGYNINIMRWVNHPWTNGALAGVWYYYFLVRVTFPNEFSKNRRIWHIIGLITGIIGMITNGFPEASALFALLILFLYLPILLARYASFKKDFKAIALRLVSLHIIGFGICSVQIFALFEYIDYTKVLELRSDYISGIWAKEDAKPYFLSNFTLLERTDLQRHYISFTAGAIGTFLALQGLASLIMDSKRHGVTKTLVGFGLFLSMLLFVSKNFGLSSAVNWFFANTPVLSTSHFPLYFSPLFYFGSAYFAALAISTYWAKQPTTNRLYHGIKAIWVVASFYLVIRAINSSAFLFLKTPPAVFWQKQFSSDGFYFLWLLIGLAAFIFSFHCLKALKPANSYEQPNRGFTTVAISILAMCGVGLEQGHTVKANFTNANNPLFFRSDSDWNAINQAVEQTKLPRHELRTRDPSGFYIQRGLATLDNGVSAMLPPRQRLVRRTLYNAPFGGYLPLQEAYFPWSGWLLSNNITAAHTTTFSKPDWSQYTPSKALEGVMLTNASGFKNVRANNPTKFWGSVKSYVLPHNSQVWGKFDDGVNQRWTQANIAGVEAKGVKGRVLTTTHWRFLLPIHEIKIRPNQLTLRVVDESNKTYQDLNTVSVKWKHNEIEVGINSELLQEYDNNSRFIYFEKSALPRAYVASGCELEKDDNTTMEKLRIGKELMAGRVIIDADLSEFCAQYNDTLRRVPILTDTGSNLTFAPIKGPAILHLNDSYYPGWKALDLNSSEELSIFRSNLAHRAIYLPDNAEYEIKLTYKPVWLIWVKLITLSSLITLIGYLVFIRKSHTSNRISASLYN